MAYARSRTMNFLGLLFLGLTLSIGIAQSTAVLTDRAGDAPPYADLVSAKLQFDEDGLSSLTVEIAGSSYQSDYTTSRHWPYFATAEAAIVVVWLDTGGSGKPDIVLFGLGQYGYLAHPDSSEEWNEQTSFHCPVWLCFADESYNKLTRVSSNISGSLLQLTLDSPLRLPEQFYVEIDTLVHPVGNPMPSYVVTGGDFGNLRDSAARVTLFSDSMPDIGYEEIHIGSNLFSFPVERIALMGLVAGSAITITILIVHLKRAKRSKSTGGSGGSLDRESRLPQSSSSVSFCISCGTTIPLRVRFCTKCGTRQPESR